jgi:hypothetical protein
MRILGRLSLWATALAALLGTSARPEHAHEKWLVGEPLGGLRWDLQFRPLTLALVGAVPLVWDLAPKKFSVWTEELRERLLLIPSVGEGERPRWTGCLPYPSAGRSASCCSFVRSMGLCSVCSRSPSRSFAADVYGGRRSVSDLASLSTYWMTGR